MQGVLRQDESRALFIGQPPVHEREVQVWIAAVNFITHDGMAKVREVDADLMFASGQWAQLEEGKGIFVAAFVRTRLINLL